MDLTSGSGSEAERARRADGLRAPVRPTVRARRALWGLLILAGGLMLYVIWPFRVPLFLAAVLAAVFQRPLARLERSLRGRRHLAGAALTLLVFVLIVVPFASVVSFLTAQMLSGLVFLRDALGVHSVTDLSAANLPGPANDHLQHLLAVAHLRPERLHEYSTRALAAAEAVTPDLLKESSRALFHTLVMLAAFYFLLIDGRRIIDWLRTVSPFGAQETEGLLSEFHRVSSATIVGTVATAFIQGVAATAGYALARVPHAVFFGLVTALAAFIPAIGTALVWVPMVAVLVFTGHPMAAIFLAAWCVVLVVGMEHIARPLILRGQVEMHTGLVFLSLLGGIEMFGLIGIVAGPLVVAFFLALLRLYAREFVERPGLHA